MVHEAHSLDASSQEPTDTSFHGLGPGEVVSTTLLPGLTHVSAVKVFLVCLAAIALPGLGHLMLGRWVRSLLLALSILGMFTVGLFWMEGHLYLPDFNEPLSIFPFLANAGLGGIYGLCYLLSRGFEAHAAVSTYEYGNTFLFVSGLLNYLVILDAYDIAVGRKV